MLCGRTMAVLVKVRSFTARVWSFTATDFTSQELPWAAGEGALGCTHTAEGKVSTWQAVPHSTGWASEEKTCHFLHQAHLETRKTLPKGGSQRYCRALVNSGAGGFFPALGSWGTRRLQPEPAVARAWQLLQGEETPTGNTRPALTVL